MLLAVVLLYQVAGSGIEVLLKGNFSDGIQDFRLGLPGMFIQVTLGYAVLKYILKK